MQHHIKVGKTTTDITYQYRFLEQKLCTDTPDAYCESKYRYSMLTKMLNCSNSIFGEQSIDTRYCSPKDVLEIAELMFSPEYIK